MSAHKDAVPTDAMREHNQHNHSTRHHAVPTDATRDTRPSVAETVHGVHTLSLAKAITAGLRAALRADDRVILMGEDIGPLGGVFRVTEGLQAEFGDQRVRDTPLAESGLVGTAIGLAMRGIRSVGMPVVIRLPYGGHIGSIEHHQESPEAYFAHTPGLRIVSPSQPHDAYWMIQEAIACNDPVLFLEPKSRYWSKGPVDFDHPGLPMHNSRVVRAGTDVTVVGHGAMVSTLLAAAEIAATEGTSIEVVDLRSLSPVDYDPLLESVRHTCRLVVAQEAYGHASLGSEIAATVAERAFYSLEAPVLRVSGFDTPYP